MGEYEKRASEGSGSKSSEEKRNETIGSRQWMLKISVMRVANSSRTTATDIGGTHKAERQRRREAWEYRQNERRIGRERERKSGEPAL